MKIKSKENNADKDKNDESKDPVAVVFKRREVGVFARDVCLNCL